MLINKLISNMLPYMPKNLVWVFSKEYIAGESIADAIEAARQLNSEGIMATIDVLGEFIKNLDEAEANKQEYLRLIDKVEEADVDSNYSLKPTSFGLLIDKEVAFNHIREIVAKAASYDNFVRIDMEDSPCTDLEIELFRKIKEEFPKNVGLVLQAYLKRTNQDIRDMKDIHSDEVPLNFRLCKGIYVEPEAIAYKKYNDINTHYLEDLELMFQEKMYPAIATHDKNLVEGAYKLIEKYGATKDQYEFQMLYGVTPALRKSILDNGHRMRVYIPFGKDWFGYSTRRLKENPNMAGAIIKAIFFKG
ncbi:Related to proline dehydrogenase [Desulfamplus magnetovallimortis]|uniref:proline dehydrogenase n=1 Tax=Desulfamplus magnetovallimortis TaxID=1246637 RepID=A0A1W1HFI3_9BACT|nr:proline dehydrogenase family protein [Desulfamplus magnetovallimortis]SLM31247.1 Related to proline dehydrogenase [Desulfamplus magnetovallimortis]